MKPTLSFESSLTSSSTSPTNAQHDGRSPRSVIPEEKDPKVVVVVGGGRRRRQGESGGSKKCRLNLIQAFCESACSTGMGGVGGRGCSSFDNYQSDPAWSPSILVLDGVKTISLGKACAEERFMEGVIRDALDRWMARMETRVAMGTVEYHHDDDERRRDVTAAGDETNRSFGENSLIEDESQGNGWGGPRPKSEEALPAPTLVTTPVFHNLHLSASAGGGESNNESLLNIPSDVQRRLPPLQAIALDHLMKSEFDLALDKFKEILDLDKESYGENHVIVSVSTHNLGVANLLAGHYSEALYYFHDAALMRKAILDKTDPLIAVSLIEVGILLYARRELERSLSVLNDAQQTILQNVNNTTLLKSEQLSTIYNNLGCVLFEINHADNIQSSLTYLQKALTIQRLVLGSAMNAESALLTMSTIFFNLGYVKMNVGLYEDALVAFDEALLVQQSVLGDCSKTVSDTMSMITMCKTYFMKSVHNSEC